MTESSTITMRCWRCFVSALPLARPPRLPQRQPRLPQALRRQQGQWPWSLLYRKMPRARRKAERAALLPTKANDRAIA
jgi:hypothetical protein